VGQDVSLQKYHRKRHFNKTPEPRGKKAKRSAALRFVVQKHDASRLHYDFRLELDGVMKSWAVPKGPSLNPADKRLAIMVEDHPLDYRKFEGTIPAGNYGAGTVIVWDEGTYEPAEPSDSVSQEQSLRDGLESGHLGIVVHGSKLNGGFSLVKLQRAKKNEWLLIKKTDEFATNADVTEQDRSVTTGRDLDEVAHNGKPHAKRRQAKTPGKKATLSANGRSAHPSTHVKPMLATLVDEPFDRKRWLFEIKWDGYRAIAEVGPTGVELYSRNDKPFAGRFAPIVESLEKLKHEAVLDGEIVAVDQDGISRFQLLQNYQKTGNGNLHYFVFDLLSLDGRDLRGLPLEERKRLLEKSIKGLPRVSCSEHVLEHGIAFFEVAQAKGLEGIIAKNATSPYREGMRGHDWLKIKTHTRQEAVIGGFTEPRGSRKDIGALVLGVYEGKNLIYIGHAGGGLGAQGLADLRAKLDPLVQKECPFLDKPKTNMPVQWVEPKLVCEVSFQEWTSDGLLRQPVILGLREDKSARSVHREIETPVEEEIDVKTAGRKPAGKHSAKEPKGSSAEPALTNLNKVFWPDEGYTKGDVIAYYREIGSVILPYLHDRPESLNRHPNGIKGKNFFQKNVSKQPPPPWVETISIETYGGSATAKYLVCQDNASLLYLANLGCIEINPWNSRLGHLDNPDYAILDLDPKDIPFARVVESALAVRKVLDKAGAASYCKTSGKRGLHIFIPLAAKYSYEAARQFAQVVATIIHNNLPDITSIVRSPAQRQQRVYLDFLQNSRGQTLAAPYSLRPTPGATVSTPLAWREVKKTLDPTKFTIKTLSRRLDKVGDLWHEVLQEGIDLEAVLTKLGRERDQ
jgi:bifunctional non-homologous end joining protein LigD